MSIIKCFFFIEGFPKPGVQDLNPCDIIIISKIHIDVGCSPPATCWAGVTLPSVWAGLAGGWRAPVLCLVPVTAGI